MHIEKCLRKKNSGRKLREPCYRMSLPADREGRAAMTVFYATLGRLVMYRAA